MKKFIISIILTLILISSFTIPVFGNTTVNQEYIKNTYGIDVYMNIYDTDDSLDEKINQFILDNNLNNNYFIFSINQRYFTASWSDDLNQYFSYDDVEYIYTNVYDYPEGSDEFYEAYYLVMDSIFSSRFGIYTVETPYHYVNDLAQVLSDSEEKALNDKLTAIVEKNNMDIVVLTTKGVSKNMRMTTADDYYDYNGYSNNGLILLVNINQDNSYSTNNSWISTCGKAIDIINDSVIDNIGNTLTPLLLNGEYYEAFDTYGDMVSNQIFFDSIIGYIVVAGISILLGLIVATLRNVSLKKELISVEQAKEANNYMVNGSLNITRSYDNLLYTTMHVTEIKQPKGGGTHRSSGGRSHGGHGF